MFSGPRFTKPTHSYGEHFGDQGQPAPPEEDDEPVAEETDDEDWAGKGYHKKPGQ